MRVAGLLLGCILFLNACSKSIEGPKLPSRTQHPIDGVILHEKLDQNALKKLFSALNSDHSLDALLPFVSDLSPEQWESVSRVLDKYIYQTALTSDGFIAAIRDNLSRKTFLQILDAIDFPETLASIKVTLSKPQVFDLIKLSAPLLSPRTIHALEDFSFDRTSVRHLILDFSRIDDLSFISNAGMSYWISHALVSIGTPAEFISDLSAASKTKDLEQTLQFLVNIDSHSQALETVFQKEPDFVKAFLIDFSDYLIRIYGAFIRKTYLQDVTQKEWKGFFSLTKNRRVELFEKLMAALLMQSQTSSKIWEENLPILIQAQCLLEYLGQDPQKDWEKNYSDRDANFFGELGYPKIAALVKKEAPSRWEIPAYKDSDLFGDVFANALYQLNKKTKFFSKDLLEKLIVVTQQIPVRSNFLKLPSLLPWLGYFPTQILRDLGADRMSDEEKDRFVELGSQLETKAPGITKFLRMAFDNLAGPTAFRDLSPLVPVFRTEDSNLNTYSEFIKWINKTKLFYLKNGKPLYPAFHDLLQNPKSILDVLQKISKVPPEEFRNYNANVISLFNDKDLNTVWEWLRPRVNAKSIEALQTLTKNRSLEKVAKLLSRIQNTAIQRVSEALVLLLQSKEWQKMLQVAENMEKLR